MSDLVTGVAFHKSLGMDVIGRMNDEKQQLEDCFVIQAKADEKTRTMSLFLVDIPRLPFLRFNIFGMRLEMNFPYSDLYCLKELDACKKEVIPVLKGAYFNKSVLKEEKKVIEEEMRLAQMQMQNQQMKKDPKGERNEDGTFKFPGKENN